MRRVRVGAHHHEEVGALDVGHGDLPHAAVHQVRADVLGPLVDGAGRVDHRDARQTDEDADVAAEAHVVREGVADVRRDRFDPVLLDHRREQFRAPSERFFPTHLAPLVAVAHHRFAQAIGVVVQVTERRALGADVALAPHVVAVAADELHLLVLDVDLEAAHRFAERTGTQMDLALRRVDRHVRSVEP